MSKPFKTLIFDLGDVIIDIDYMVTVGEFQKLAKIDFSQLVSYSKQHHLFDKFETGHITPQQFRNELKQYLKDDTTDEAIDMAWNSILIHYPEKKIALLQQLKSKYRTLALSNINELHVAAIDLAARSKFGLDNFESLFHKAYYSNQVGHRKPEKEIFELVINAENINPADTFFVDDKAENVEAAKSLGLQAYQLKERDKLHELLQSLDII
jgi:putative hydrolase of the HAD superfamily